MNLPSREVLVPREIRICYKRPLFDDMVSVNSSDEAVKTLHALLEDDQLDYKECFWVLSLTTTHRLLGISMIAQGTQYTVAIATKEIAHIAVMTHAFAVIVMHNHPSRKACFSENDRALTKVITQCLGAFDIKLLDHIVITTDSHISMADEGCLPQFNLKTITEHD
ncbi:MAG: hypothetical protein NXI10_03485 [bacterium]|nr:hypothetical protein [bacterium]